MEKVRGLAAVLFRREYGRGDKSLWGQLSPATRLTIQSELLVCVELEKIQHIRSKLGDCVAEIGMVVKGKSINSKFDKPKKIKKKQTRGMNSFRSYSNVLSQQKRVRVRIFGFRDL